MKANIERTEKKRIVIVGGGLGGLELAFKLVDDDYQVVLVDKNNYHQFPPLIYQVASGGLEPSSISFPFRRLFQGKKDFFFRMAKVESVNTDEKVLFTLEKSTERKGDTTWFETTRSHLINQWRELMIVILIYQYYLIVIVY